MNIKTLKHYNFKQNSKDSDIVMIMGSTRSIPSGDNSSNAIGEMIIQLTEKLSFYKIKVISNWNPSLIGKNYDKSKYLHVNRSIIDKVYYYILPYIPYRLKKYVYGYTDTNRIIYYIGVKRLLKKINPSIVISHVHFYLFKCAKSAVPDSKHIFYFHSSNLGDWGKTELKFLFNTADGILSVCNYAFIDVKKKHDLVHLNTQVIHNGLQRGQFTIQKRLNKRLKNRLKYGMSNDDIVMLYAGRIHPSKGIDLIIKTFLDCYQKNKNIRLIVVGGGHSKYDDSKFEEEIIQISDRIENNIIQFIGWKDHKEMMNIYSLADISILASLKVEGCPFFILESMACGLPVVSTNIGGVPEIVTNNHTGLLINRNNIKDELQIAIQRLIKDKTLRNRLGENASNHIDSNLNLDIMSGKLDEYLQTFI